MAARSAGERAAQRALPDAPGIAIELPRELSKSHEGGLACAAHCPLCLAESGVVEDLKQGAPHEDEARCANVREGTKSRFVAS